MTRDELYSLRRGRVLRRVTTHAQLPACATYVDWVREDAFRRVIRGDDGREHALTDREMCSLYELA